MKPKYLKIVFNDWKNASRDKRELSVVREMGYAPIVIATTKQGEKICRDKVDGYRVIRIPTRRYGEGKAAVIMGRMKAIIDFVFVAKRMEADIISGHNYLGLLVGYICNRIQRKKQAKLIYDSHEFELYQIERSRFRFMLVKMVEGFLARRADINMMVSDSIADEFQNIYHLSDRPVVVRNTPEYWILDEEKIQTIRHEYLLNLEIDSNGTVLMFHGGLLADRKIENIIDALQLLDNTGLVILGDAKEWSYYEFLVKKIADAHLAGRVYFHKSVPHEKLCNYVAAADIGMMTHDKEIKNLNYCLPNKFFENIQALTPIICSNLFEIKKIINKYGIGIVVDSGTPDELAEAVSRLKCDYKMYLQLKHNLKQAKEELCWEVEKMKIVGMVNSLEINTR